MVLHCVPIPSKDMVYLFCALVFVYRLSFITIETMSTLRNLQLSSGVFFLAFAMSLVSAQNDLELSPRKLTIQNVFIRIPVTLVRTERCCLLGCVYIISSATTFVHVLFAYLFSPVDYILIELFNCYLFSYLFTYIYIFSHLFLLNIVVFRKWLGVVRRNPGTASKRPTHIRSEDSEQGPRGKCTGRCWNGGWWEWCGSKRMQMCGTRLFLLPIPQRP